MEHVYSGPTEPPEPVEPGQPFTRHPDDDPAFWDAVDPDAHRDQDRPAVTWDQLGGEAWGEEHWNWDGTRREDIRVCTRCHGPAQVVTRETVVDHQDGRTATTTWAICPVCKLEEIRP